MNYTHINTLKLSGLLMSSTLASQATVLFYDSFAAGGSSPNANQYQSDPASTNGINNDSITRSISESFDGQAPATLGFDSSGWQSNEGAAATVYGRIDDNSLIHSSLVDTPGSFNVFRSGSNSSGSQRKEYARQLTSNLGNGASELYFSALVNFTSGLEANISIIQGASNVVGFGFDASGNAEVFGSAYGTIDTSTASFAGGQTHLLVAKVYNDGGTERIDLWVNPNDLANEANNASSQVLSGVELTSGNFVTGNAISRLRFSAGTGNSISDPNQRFDEVRGATTWAEAFNVVPEPGNLALLALGSLSFLRRRRRSSS
ncbi:MAG: PEP-CTERM sorting domain-containing protein [Verrucomicrobiales bacterium]